MSWPAQKLVTEEPFDIKHKKIKRVTPILQDVITANHLTLWYQLLQEVLQYMQKPHFASLYISCFDPQTDTYD